MNNTEDLKKIFNNIINPDEEDIIIEVPVSKLIWRIVMLSDQMVDYEDKIFEDDNLSLKEKSYYYEQKEYCACRRDEIAKIITHFSNYDTSKIWDETNKMFKEY